MKNYCLLFLLLLTNWTAYAQSNLQALVDEWADDDYLLHASVGVCISDARTGEIVASYQPQRSLIPASNLKVLSTASALAILGADYRFTTTLAYDGYIDATGILNGNLYLIGTGDPSLGSTEISGNPSLESILANWRLAVQQAGIRQVTGRVITDASAFTSAANGSHWQWLDMGNYYGCGTFGLNLNENLYRLSLQKRAGLGSTPTMARVEPAIPGLQFTNEITSAERGSGDNAYIYGAPYTYQRYLRGTIPVGSSLFTIKGSIPDPPLFAAQQLMAALESVGILCQQPPQVQQQPSHNDAPARQILHTHRSPTLLLIAKRTNMKSVNLYAEAILRAVAYEQSGLGSTEAGLAIVREYWTKLGLDFAGVQLYDGSGMSPRNVLPTAFFTSLLSTIYQDPSLRDDFLSTLPLAGRSGSLRNSFKGTAAEGQLRAKSGSLEQVRAYTGYVPAANGRMLAFSILLNNYDGEGGPARRKLLRLMAQLTQ